MNQQHHILIVGDTTSREMQGVVTTLRELRTVDELRFVPNIPEALVLCDNEHWFPDLLILCQNWSHEFSEEEITNVLTTMPLARMVCCYGIWSEADGRNYDLLPFASRVQARLATERIRYEWDVINGKQPAVPLTANRYELFDNQLAEELPLAPANGSISIVSPDRSLREYWHELFTTTGWNVIADSENKTGDLLLYDLDPWSSEMATSIISVHRDQSDLVIVGMMNACLPEDYAEATACGVAEILSKLAPAQLLLQSVIALR